MKKKVFYAVSKSGQGRIFTTLPERDEHWGMWLGESVGCISTLFMLFLSDGLQLPTITWKDEPVEITVTVSV